LCKEKDLRETDVILKIKLIKGEMSKHKLIKDEMRFETIRTFQRLAAVFYKK
jgi:hypothetical protein